MSVRHHRLHAGRWAAVRRAVFRRDGWRCTACGKAGRLEAHHEPPLRAGANPYDVAGIVTLCRACHIERHRHDKRREPTPDELAWQRMVGEIVA
ncbi:MAG: hypothetical protein OXI20_05400 [Rhodospirillales bacterium]|nr:hypothetical protein [Rhodospirillales bacterium]